MWCPLIVYPDLVPTGNDIFMYNSTEKVVAATLCACKYYSGEPSTQSGLKVYQVRYQDLWQNM